MFLGALQLTNMYGDTYLSDLQILNTQTLLCQVFNNYHVDFSNILKLIYFGNSFYLKRFGIKQVMLISMFAWVLRFGLFAYGNPGDGLWMIICLVVYGRRLTFNISGSLFIETTTDFRIRSVRRDCL
jgi:NHS family xanthosine MFS transporter